MGFTPRETLLWVSSLAAACLLCPVPPQHFYPKHSGHLEVTGKHFGMSRCSLPLAPIASAEVSVGSTLADFLIYMSGDYSNRIMCLKKDYLAGSCLPNISLEQILTAEIQWPDSNVYDRNSASYYFMPATHWPLSHWKTLLSKWLFLSQMVICSGNIPWCF